MNIALIKKSFPIFQNDLSLTYLDSTATSLKPQIVIDTVNQYYSHYSSNIHRGIYKIAEKATQEYENARKTVSSFIHANRPEEVIFTRGTTEGLNLVASTIGQEVLSEGDEIVTTIMEHHSNFVPWQELAKRANARLKVIPIDQNYELSIIKALNHNNIRSQGDPSSQASQDDVINLSSYISPRTKIVTIAYVSNMLGTINPVKKIITSAKKINPDIICVVDAAQAVPHLPIDVQELGCDFLAFSGHKMCGPTGIGVLWGRYELLKKLKPYQFGGEMIDQVSIEKTTFAKPPHKFEAGTPPIAQAIGLGAAIEYLQSIGLEKIHIHEKLLVTFCVERLKEEFGDEITIFSPPDDHRSGIVTFTFKTHHPHDVAHILDEQQIAVRAGHHCTMPLHTYLGISASTRASFYLYNTEEDVEKLVKGLKVVKKTLG